MAGAQPSPAPVTSTIAQLSDKALEHFKRIFQAEREAYLRPESGATEGPEREAVIATQGFLLEWKEWAANHGQATIKELLKSVNAGELPKEQAQGKLGENFGKLLCLFQEATGLDKEGKLFFTKYKGQGIPIDCILGIRTLSAMGQWYEQHGTSPALKQQYAQFVYLKSKDDGKFQEFVSLTKGKWGGYTNIRPPSGTWRPGDDNTVPTLSNEPPLKVAEGYSAELKSRGSKESGVDFVINVLGKMGVRTSRQERELIKITGYPDNASYDLAVKNSEERTQGVIKALTDRGLADKVNLKDLTDEQIAKNGIFVQIHYLDGQGQRRGLPGIVKAVKRDANKNVISLDILTSNSSDGPTEVKDFKIDSSMAIYASVMKPRAGLPTEQPTQPLPTPVSSPLFQLVSNYVQHQGGKVAYTQKNCVQFLECILEEYGKKYGFSLSKEDKDLININYRDLDDNSAYRKAVEENDPRTKGAVGALLKKGVAAELKSITDLTPDLLKRGVVTQYHYLAPDGTQKGHAGIITNVEIDEGTKQVTAFWVYSSSRSNGGTGLMKVEVNSLNKIYIGVFNPV